jgi:exopolysaccharide production protein ExoQ
MIFTTILVFATLLFAFSIVLFFGGGLAVSTKLGNAVLAWVFPLIGASILLSTIASGRNVDLYVLNPSYSFGGGSTLSVWVLRGCMWSILAICGGYLLSTAFSAKSEIRSGKGLFSCFVAYFFFGFVVNGFFGTVPSVDYKTLYSLIIVTAFYFGQSISIERLVKFAKMTGIISIFLGLIAAMISPKISIQSHFVGVLPWLPIRLWGLDSHANTLGPLAAVILLLEIAYPFEKKSRHLAGLLIGGVALLLTQSKTAWIAFIVAIIAFALLKIYSSAADDASRSRMKATTVASIVFVVFVVISLVLIAMFGDFDKQIAKYLATAEGSKISSLTGRDAIWRATFSAWERNIIFGYGPELWGPSFSAKYHLLGIASNAHNQAVDVLGSSGLLGLISFFVYLIALMRNAIRVREVTGWFPLVLLIALIVRSISEVPFRLINSLSNDFSLHLLLLGILFSASNKLEVPRLIVAKKN